MLNPKVMDPLFDQQNDAVATKIIAAWLITPKREGYRAAWRFVETPNGPGYETVFKRINDDHSVDVQGCASCADCGVNTIAIREWYLLRDTVWEQAWPSTANGEEVGHGHYLCIGCIEKRLGRELNGRDFVGFSPRARMSARLRDRRKRAA